MKRLLCALLALVSFCSAQTATPGWETMISGVPSVVMLTTTLTAVVSTSWPGFNKYVRVDKITLHNISSSAVTVYILDGSTNCNGAACAVISASATGGLSIAANTTYSISLVDESTHRGQPANGGVLWYASAANAVEGWMNGTK